MCHLNQVQWSYSDRWWNKWTPRTSCCDALSKTHQSCTLRTHAHPEPKPGGNLRHTDRGTCYQVPSLHSAKTSKPRLGTWSRTQDMKAKCSLHSWTECPPRGKVLLGSNRHHWDKWHILSNVWGLAIPLAPTLLPHFRQRYRSDEDNVFDFRKSVFKILGVKGHPISKLFSSDSDQKKKKKTNQQTNQPRKKEKEKQYVKRENDKVNVV